jgi:hypothetical protein
VDTNWKGKETMLGKTDKLSGRSDNPDEGMGQSAQDSIRRRGEDFCSNPPGNRLGEQASVGRAPGSGDRGEENVGILGVQGNDCKMRLRNVFEIAEKEVGKEYREKLALSFCERIKDTSVDISTRKRMIDVLLVESGVEKVASRFIDMIKCKEVPKPELQIYMVQAIQKKATMTEHALKYTEAFEEMIPKQDIDLNVRIKMLEAFEELDKMRNSKELQNNLMRKIFKELVRKIKKTEKKLGY